MGKSTTSQGQPSAEQGRLFATLAAWLDAHANRLLDDPSNNLIAIGVGKKSAGPIDDASPYCITGFVEQKLTKKEVSDRGLPLFSAAAASVAAVKTPEALGFEIDVVETGSTFKASPGLSAPRAQRGLYGGLPPVLDLQKRFNHLRSGIGVTNPHRHYPQSLSVGTLGFFVQDDSGQIYLVSNNHVIGDENNARTGDAVVQPGTLDLTSGELALMPTIAKLNATMKIAKLTALVKILFHTASGIPFNDVDCAAAALDDTNSRDSSEIARIGFGGKLTGVAPPFSVDPVTGQVTGSTRVYKAGRTTGWTEGDVTHIGVVTDVAYGAGLARFRNQIAVSASSDNGGPFSSAGDSGSGVVNADQQLAGLLFAGSEMQTLMNPIHRVLAELTSALGVASLTVVT